MPIFPQESVWSGMEAMEDELREREMAICPITCSLPDTRIPVTSHNNPRSPSERPYRYPHLKEVVQASGSELGLYHQIP